MKKKLKILMVEDSKDDAVLIIRNIKKDGLDPVYERVETPEEMKAALDSKEWDIVLSDYKLPQFNGLDALKLFRRKNLEIPFIIISGTIGEELAVETMRKGASDYLMKDNLARLVPSIKRELDESRTRRERKKALEDLFKSEKKFKELVEMLPEMVFEIDLEGNIIIANSTAFKKFGFTNNKANKSINISNLIIPGEREKLKENIKKIFSGENPGLIEYIALKNDGSTFPIMVHSNLVLDDKGKKIGLRGIAIDITSQKKAAEKIKYLSFHDNLTGLYNRAFFEEELKRLDKGRQLPLTMIVGDVNGLKLINDAFSHSQGDLYLCKIARILEESFRAEDIVARWGGDEFSILLPKTRKEDALVVIERIRKKCKKASSKNIPLSISLGVSEKTENKQSIGDILIEAEDNMYKRKLLERKSISSSIISSLERTLWEKSHETEEHAGRLKVIALKIGKSLGLPENKLDELSLLSTLHDIGKIAIPEEILLKKEKLTKKEWDIIKRHPEIGYNIAESAPQLTPIAEAILSHHEWWNGKGYPHGLDGEDILITSRIIAIADAYDVMTIGRSYKNKVSKKDAINELKRCSGEQFDPRLVDEFVEIMGGQ